ERLEGALPAQSNDVVVAFPPLAFLEPRLDHAYARLAVAGRLARDVERHRTDRVAVGRQPERVGDKESVARMELHHGAPEHPAEAPQDLVAKIRRQPLDGVRPERARRGHRMRDLPPGAERVAVEESLDDSPRGRGNHDRNVEI